MRILFITATRIGDAVLSTGLLDHLLRAHPSARFTIACGPAAVGVFARMPRREATLVVEKRRYDAHWLDLWRRTVLKRWDLVVDLRGSALAYALPARRRVVLRGGGGGGHKLAQLAGVLNLADPPLPVGWVGPADEAKADALLPRGAALIGLGPTANWSGKVWPAERFVALADRALGAAHQQVAAEGPHQVAVGGDEGHRDRERVGAAIGQDGVDLVAQAAVVLALDGDVQRDIGQDVPATGRVHRGSFKVARHEIPRVALFMRRHPAPCVMRNGKI